LFKIDRENGKDFLRLSDKKADENYCNILQGDGKTLCLTIARNDKSPCNQLPLKIRTHDFIKKIRNKRKRKFRSG